MNSMIPVKEFAERRRKLTERMAPDSIAIIPAAPERVRNRDVLHPFRQDSDSDCRHRRHTAGHD